MHFAPSDVLRAQINAIDGWLTARARWGRWSPVGSGSGDARGLRNAFGQHDDKGNWIPRQPNVQLYQQELEPHARGDILVSAMFELSADIQFSTSRFASPGRTVAAMLRLALFIRNLSRP